MESLKVLAPLHNPANIIAIKAFREALPNALSVAVFDTGFHQTMPEENVIYSIPYEYYKNTMFKNLEHMEQAIAMFLIGFLN